MKSENYLQIMLIGFVAILFGVVVISTMSDQTQSTTTLNFHNDSLNLASAGYKNATGSINTTKNYTLTYPATEAWMRDNANCKDPALVVTLDNGTTQALTLTTHYTYDSARSIVGFKNVQPLNSTGIGANQTYLTYSTCPTGYMTESWTRAVYNMVPGFFALGILGVALFVAMRMLSYMQKEE